MDTPSLPASNQMSILHLPATHPPKIAEQSFNTCQQASTLYYWSLPLLVHLAKQCFYSSAPSILYSPSLHLHIKASFHHKSWQKVKTVVISKSESVGSTLPFLAARFGFRVLQDFPVIPCLMNNAPLETFSWLITFCAGHISFWPA